MQLKKIVLWAVIVYFAVGFVFAADYLRNESKTYECPQPDGTVVTVFVGDSNAPQPADGCAKRVFSINTISTSGSLFILWLPMVANKIAHSF